MKLVHFIPQLVAIFVFGVSVIFPTGVLAQSDPAPPVLFATPDATAPRPKIQLPNLINKDFINAEDPGDTKQTFETFAGRLIGLLLLVGGILAFFYALWGGVVYLSAGGNAGQTEQARKMIIGALVGIGIMALSYAVVEFLAGQTKSGLAGTVTEESEESAE